MAVCVLVHGAWHGAWCWDSFVPVLEGAGHRGIAIDLPGSGDDPTPAAEVTLEAYAARVVERISALDEPVILIGHSLGGLTLTPVAEAIPDRLRALVYVAAYLLPDGESLLSWRKGRPDTVLTANRVMSPDGLTVTLREGILTDLFYADCAPEAARRAISRLRPQPVAVYRAPMRVTPERFGRVPRYYVECVQDRAIPVEDQRELVAATPCRKVFSLDSSHSPFLSMPERLAECIDEVARLEPGGA